MIRVEHGDCREIIPTLGVAVDAVVTDPPYHLGPQKTQEIGWPSWTANTKAARGSAKAGFMGQQWDGGDIAFQPETWRIIGESLRPGGFLVAFGGTRTYHKMATAIEAAGFTIQDCLMWLFACLDEQTQVATADGVKPHNQTSVGDMVLCYNPDTSEYSYQPILEIVEYEYSDTAYRLSGDFGEQVVTRNHRCIIERDGGETFQVAETLERAARVPVLENLPHLQEALSDLYGRASKPQQELRPRLCGHRDKRSENRQVHQAAHLVRALRQGDYRPASVETVQAGASLLQPAVPSEGECHPPTAVLRQRQGQAPPRDGVDDWRAESILEGRPDLPQSQGSIRQPADPLCALPSAIPEHGPSRRLRDGASAFGGNGYRSAANPRGVGSPHKSQCDGQQPHEPYALCHQRPAQGIRAWSGHKTALVRVVPFHYTGKVWCLRVPTGAFVAVRNGVAFPTGNSGFPKRRDMLKPAYEPIVLAYKPGGKRTMQVDECRVGVRERPKTTDPKRTSNVYGQIDNPGGKLLPAARWPANICHDGSDEVVTAFPESAGSHDQQASVSDNSWFTAAGHYDGNGRNDSGSAARFFFSSKAGSQDRWGSKHPTVKPVELMKWLVKLVCPENGTCLDPFAGSGTTGVAALATGRNAILIEREAQYHEDIKRRLAFYEGGGSHSVQAKNRNRKTDAGPLFAEPAFDAALDSKLSYHAAIQAIGERVAAGEPLPTGGYFGGEE